MESPMVRFQVHGVGYFLFLILFSCIAIQHPDTPTPTVLEWILIATVVGYAANELYQVKHVDAKGQWEKTKKYLSSFWNQVDITALFLFLVAIALRFSGNKEARIVGHLFYAIDLSIWIVRIMQYFNDDPVCGPYVHMILRMFGEMMKFLLILLVFLVSFGMSARCILEQHPFHNERVISSVFKPFMAIFGEYFIDDRTNTTTLFGTDLHNNYAESLAFVYLIVYLLIANVLLLNVLIAIFNNTFTEVMTNSSRTWKFNRYALILEYAQQRTFLFPPISLIFHLCYLIQTLVFKLCINTNPDDKFCDVVHHPSLFRLYSHEQHGLRVKIKKRDERAMNAAAMESECMLSALRQIKSENECESTIYGSW